MLLLLATPARPASAQAPYSITVQMSAYGPCCYSDSPGAGYISYYGEYQQLEPWKVSIASPYLRRGTPICVEVPPQADAYGATLRTLGALKCDRPLSPGAVGFPHHLERGALTVSDHIPIWHNRHDASRGFLDDIGFCHPGEGEYTCLFRWGVRTIEIYVFG
jgi:hypothetical protein